jgi:hypothetical protein
MCKVGTEITNLNAQKGNTVQAARGRNCKKIKNLFFNFFLLFFALLKFNNLKYLGLSYIVKRFSFTCSQRGCHNPNSPWPVKKLRAFIIPSQVEFG